MIHAFLGIFGIPLLILWMLLSDRSASDSNEKWAPDLDQVNVHGVSYSHLSGQLPAVRDYGESV